MSSLDSRIDDLYQLPLAEFTAARNALAKTLTGDEAARVKKLEKPSVVAWSVNQVHWRARPIYDRLIASGKRVRITQLATLEGRSGDTREAADRHRQAIAAAVAEATKLAAAESAHPSPDELTQTFETLSLAAEPPEAHGRLTRALRPAGFEALAGIAPRAVSGRAKPPRPTHPPSARTPAPRERAVDKRAIARAEADVRKATLAFEKAQTDLERAKSAVEEARAAETKAREVWARAKLAVDRAQSTLDRVKQG
jgi:hypothetical protein